MRCLKISFPQEYDKWTHTWEICIATTPRRVDFDLSSARRPRNDYDNVTQILIICHKHCHYTSISAPTWIPGQCDWTSERDLCGVCLTQLA